MKRFEEIVKARRLAHDKLGKDHNLIFKKEENGQYRFVNIYCQPIYVDLKTQTVERTVYDKDCNFLRFEKV